MSRRFILAGEAVRTQGIKGLLKVKPFADLDILLDAENLFIGKDDFDPREYEVVSTQLHKGAVLLGLDGIETMSDAEMLVGNHVYADMETLPELADGEYYQFEIIGLDVYTDDGLPIGKIKEIFSTGSNDVYVVRGEGREHLIPAIEDVVREIDLPGKRMVIHPMKGLLGDE